MKLSRMAWVLGIISSCVFASENSMPIDGVTVSLTEYPTLSVQNRSKNVVQIDIYGDEFSLLPASGLTFECAGYPYLEIQVQGMVHDYFEVPCQSRIVFGDTFNNQQ
ncbi:hypothetical protein L4D77_24520 [Photobacterium frigidiphilum]|uniref:hypothetical protein n=1 Tax=Photobacterium frigidiphilum TaxID=264736 RepID=UPI003D0A6CDB